LIEKQLLIVNKLGLHARAAVKFVKLASGFEAEIQLLANHRCVNGKSIMGIMMLAASRGTEVTLRVDGPDEEAAALRLERLIRDGFGEPE